MTETTTVQLNYFHFRPWYILNLAWRGRPVPDSKCVVNSGHAHNTLGHNWLHSYTCESKREDLTSGDRVRGMFTARLSRFTASVMAGVSTSSREQHRFFTDCTTRSTVLYWVLWGRQRGQRERIRWNPCSHDAFPNLMILSHLNRTIWSKVATTGFAPCGTSLGLIAGLSLIN